MAFQGRKTVRQIPEITCDHQGEQSEREQGKTYAKFERSFPMRVRESYDMPHPSVDRATLTVASVKKMNT